MKRKKTITSSTKTDAAPQKKAPKLIAVDIGLIIEKTKSKTFSNMRLHLDNASTKDAIQVQLSNECKTRMRQSFAHGTSVTKIDLKVFDP